MTRRELKWLIGIAKNIARCRKCTLSAVSINECLSYYREWQKGNRVIFLYARK